MERRVAILISRINIMGGTVPRRFGFGVRRGRRFMGSAIGAPAVVFGALIGIVQDLIRKVDALHPLVCVGGVVHIGMIHAREATVGGLYDFRLCQMVNLQFGV